MLCATHDRPDHLRHLAACLKVQTFTDHSLVAIWQGTEPQDVGAINLRYPTFPRDWGATARAWAIKEHSHLLGEWIGCTNDDNYYVPTYYAEMMRIAKQNGADFVYCDMLHNMFSYRPVDVKPEPLYCDLGGFLARRELILSTPWPNTDVDYADGLWIKALAQNARKVAKHTGVLFVHN